MTISRRRAVAWGVAALIVASLIFGLFPFVSTLRADEVGPNAADFGADIGGLVASLALTLMATALGLLVVTKQPTNPSGFLLLVFALAFPWGAIAAHAADWSFVRGEAPTWLGIVIAYLFAPGIFGSWVAIAVFLLVFPTGRFLSNRWRWLAWAGVLGAALIGMNIFNARLFASGLDQKDFVYAPGIDNPLAIEAIPRDVFDLAFAIGIWLLYAALFGGILSLIVRFWRSRGEERQQLKVVAFGIGTFAVLALLAANLNQLGGPFSWVWDNAMGFLVIVVFVSFAVALLRYRLYDIDVVINKTIVYGSMVAFITAVYAAVAFVPFVVLGAGDSRAGTDLWLPLLATLVLVLLFQPVRERLQRVANRLVYGGRATPYEALRQFSATVAGSFADEELLTEMAAILAQGTGADPACVWIAGEGRLVLTAAAPSRLSGEDELTLVDGHLPEVPGTDAVVPVRHHGELLGALSITKRPGDPVRPIEHQLLDDLASHAGVVLRNFRLNEQLLERLTELRASRQRLVAAQDEERRRLERNLHDGAQQQLVALKVKLGLVRRVQDSDERDQMLQALMRDADDAIEDLRDLARGIYPPVLAEKGLVGALRGLAIKATIPTDVDSNGIGRYPAEVEAAVYFCALEAMQNIAKYADANASRVALRADDGHLHFDIEDDGRGFDIATTSLGAGLQNMTDRIEALGGSIQIDSAPGDGTTIAAVIPAVETKGQPS